MTDEKDLADESMNVQVLTESDLTEFWRFAEVNALDGAHRIGEYRLDEIAALYALVVKAKTNCDHVAEVDRLTKERDEAIALTEEARKTLSEDTSYGAIIETLFRAPLVETESKLRAAEQRISELTSANEEKARKIADLIDSSVNGCYYVSGVPLTREGFVKRLDAILNGGQQ